MPENRQVQSNGGVAKSSNSSADNIEEAIRRLKIGSGHNQHGGSMGTSYPDRPGEPDCIYYLRTGMCGYGINCRFNHPPYTAQNGGELPERFGQPECGYFMKTGTCKYGPTCKYHHPRDRQGLGPVYLNMLGLPLRQEEKPCAYYMRTGSCKFGVACKFNHPQPASVGTALPVPGPTPFGSTTSILPSSSAPYVDGLSTGSLPKTTYLPSPHLQGPQTYMPVVFRPLPAQGWNTYMGSMSPVSSTGVLSEPSMGSQMHLLSTSVSNLPERPHQPECRHFINTGRCKYGSDCKYHHPREKISELQSNFLGPLGLPLRPGEAICSYYSLYGLCRFGPTCKFDHPLAGYSYGYSLSLPTLSMLDPSLLPYQRNSTTVLSSETSLSKSSKVVDWIHKPEAARNEDKNSGHKTPDSSAEQNSSPPQSD